jgi:hypothetical protein
MSGSGTNSKLEDLATFIDNLPGGVGVYRV